MSDVARTESRGEGTTINSMTTGLMEVETWMTINRGLKIELGGFFE